MQALRKPVDADCASRTLKVDLAEASIHTEVIEGPPRTARLAIFIHGGGMGGNHTLVERPARLLIEDGYFDVMILPDRRGEGESSAQTAAVSIAEHAADMKALLDHLEVEGPLTALGISYGGPIALALAQSDPRIERAVLLASGPTLQPQRAAVRALIGSGLYERGARLALRRLVGTRPPAPADFDSVYDMSTTGEVAALFQDALRRTPPDRLESLLWSIRATLDAQNAGLPGTAPLTVPVLRIIGERDEVWGRQLSGNDRDRLPMLTERVVEGARRHKDVFFKAGAFYAALSSGLREQGVAPVARPD